MQTLIDTITDGFTLEKRRLAAKNIEVLRSGLFGVSHWKIKDMEFEQITVGGWRRGWHWWVMRRNGKEYKIKYSYALYLTFKHLDLLPKNKI